MMNMEENEHNTRKEFKKENKKERENEMDVKV